LRALAAAFAAALAAGCGGEPDLPAAYERCVGATVQRSLAANPKPVPPEVRPQFEAMQRQLAEGACGQQREACEKEPSGSTCKAFLGRYGR
jgi:hypothetical protein